mmetsp:Transcript_20440/g.30340  ORF Transcript_20440/g.30340 Transcript_20440/m.30340 type:complete len:182 (-) Transcript_20440:4257-4802(-)
MLKTLLFFACLLQSTIAECPPVQDGGCSICGDGKCIGAPDAIFSFPGHPPVPCGTLETVGLTGSIPLSQCAFLPGLIVGLCECNPNGIGAPIASPPVANAAPVDLTEAPIVPPTDAPVAPSHMPATLAPSSPSSTPSLSLVPSITSLPSSQPITTLAPKPPPVTMLLPTVSPKKTGKKRKL